MIATLRDLTERIAEASKGSFSGSSSWFGKSRGAKGDNFWKSLETNLTKFVAGDEAAEDLTAANGKRSLDVQDPRFGRIASDTSLNRMASLPNLRGQSTTPVYSGFPQELRGGGAHSRYSTNNSESRYTPGTRFEQSSRQDSQEYDHPRSVAGSGVTSPEPSNAGYSPYVPQALPEHYSESLEPTPTESEPEPVNECKATDESDKSSKEKGKGKHEKKGMFSLNLHLLL
jgi:Sec23-binding domain of Sec16